MRLASAIAVVAIAFAAAVYIHERHTTRTFTVCLPASGATGYGSAYKCAKTKETLRRHPSWEDPVAVLLALGGLAVAAGIVTTGRRES